MLGRADWAWAARDKAGGPGGADLRLWPFVSLAKRAVKCHLVNMFPLCQVGNLGA